MSRRFKLTFLVFVFFTPDSRSLKTRLGSVKNRVVCPKFEHPTLSKYGQLQISIFENNEEKNCEWAVSFDDFFS